MSVAPHLDLSEPLLTPADVAALLRVKPSTVYEWVRNGSMPCIRLGGRAVRFSRSMVEEWALTHVEGGRGNG